MIELSKKLVKVLQTNGETISTMESCTGGGLANVITNVSGSSDVFELGYVTYSNNAKEFIGVKKDLIDKYTVYSKEVACDMAKTALRLAKSTYSVGITGMLDKEDDNIYVCILNGKTQKEYTYILKAESGTRQDKKEKIITKILENLLDII